MRAGQIRRKTYLPILPGNSSRLRLLAKLNKPLPRFPGEFSTTTRDFSFIQAEELPVATFKEDKLPGLEDIKR